MKDKTEKELESEKQDALDNETEQKDWQQRESESEKKCAELNDKYLRLLAESENLRKRLHKEKAETVQYAIEDVIEDFLHPIDQLESALRHAKNMGEEVKIWAKGFEMILSHFKEVLEKRGVLPFHSVGEVFDPMKHEAVDVIETDEAKKDTILKETQAGYKMGDKILRAAKVIVAKEQRKKEQENTQEGDR